MGVVYKAKQIGLNRTVAVKMVIAGVYLDPITRARFLLEAESVAALEHPNIVKVFAFGEHDGQPFLAMEFLSNGNLADRVKASGPLPFREAAQLASKLASAVEHAHIRGVVHRDIKPANVLLSPNGDPRLTDFGLAKVGRRDLDVTGQVLGTPAYMAPEQAAGKVHDVGTPADIYALGAVLYDLLTGHPPFRGDSAAATLHLVLNAEPERPRKHNPSIPRDLETICLKCLEKEPPQRYATAQEVADDLNRYLGGQPIRARPAGSVERAVKWVRRNTGLTVAVMAVALALVIGAGVAIGFGIDAKNEAQRANGEATRANEESTRADRERDVAISEAARANRIAKELADALDEANNNLSNSKIMQAKSALATGDMGRARELLSEIPKSYRRWEWGYLMRETDRSLFTLGGHSGDVLACFSRSGERILTMGLVDSTVRVWDARTGTLVAELKCPTRFMDARFSPDETKVLTANEDGTAKVWDTHTGKLIVQLQGHTGPIYMANFSEGGSQIVTGSHDMTARVWEAYSGKMITEMKGHTGPVFGVRFSKDGLRVLTKSEDRTAREWNARTGEMITQRPWLFQAHGLAFSPDGILKVLAGPDNTVQIWDTRSDLMVVELKGHPKLNQTSYGLMVASFSPDGTKLVTASQDKVARVWDVTTGSEIVVLKGHAAWVRTAEFSPDGLRVVTGGFDGTARVWDVSGGSNSTLSKHSIAVISATFSADSSRLVTTSIDNTVWV